MLFRKMLRDMSLHKTQFISIFLMSILGVFIYAGISSEWFGLQTTINGYYKETNLADIWLYGKSFSREDAGKVRNVKGVTDVQRRLTIDGVADMDNKPELTLHFIEENRISKSKLVTGEEFSPEKDGIWLDNSFATARGLGVGDFLSITANGLTIKKKILGTVYNPEYVYATGKNDMVPNHANSGFAILSSNAFPKEVPIFYTELLITTDGTDPVKMEDRVDQALNGHYSVFLPRKHFESYAVFHDEIEQHKAMGQVFPIAFLAIAMLTILTTMTRMISSQRTQIGTLKALGFHRRRILFHYVSYGLWISLSGAVIGTLAGPQVLPYLFYDSLKTAYTLPEWKPAISAAAFAMALVSTAGCTFVSYMACRKVLKDTPAQTLRPKAPAVMKRSVVEKTGLWRKLGFSAQWNLRDISRSKVRSLMAVIGVLGCTALLVCAAGMQDSLKDVVTWQYSEIYQFQTKLMLKEQVTPEQVENIKEKYDGESMMEGVIELKAKGIKKSAELLVTEEATMIHPENSDRQEIQLPKDRVSISYKLAKLLDVTTGDEISWHIYGDEKWVTSVIGSVYRTPIAQGITLTREKFEQLGYPYQPTAVISPQKVDHMETGVESVRSKAELSESYETMTEAMNIMVYILILAAVILAIVVLYNLGVLSFTERVRELATLKVLGFKSKKIRRLLLLQASILTVAGIAFGIPGGKWLIGYMISFMGDNFDMMTIVTMPSLIGSILGTFLLSVLVNLMFSKKIGKIDMVSSLKGVE